MIKDKRDNGKSERNETLKSILNNYKGDRKRALKEHPDLETLYDLSDLRENLLEWRSEERRVGKECTGSRCRGFRGQ